MRRKDPWYKRIKIRDYKSFGISIIYLILYIIFIIGGLQAAADYEERVDERWRSGQDAAAIPWSYIIGLICTISYIYLSFLQLTKVKYKFTFFIWIIELIALIPFGSVLSTYQIVIDLICTSSRNLPDDDTFCPGISSSSISLTLLSLLTTIQWVLHTNYLIAERLYNLGY